MKRNAVTLASTRHDAVHDLLCFRSRCPQRECSISARRDKGELSVSLEMDSPATQEPRRFGFPVHCEPSYAARSNFCWDCLVPRPPSRPSSPIGTSYLAMIIPLHMVAPMTTTLRTVSNQGCITIHPPLKKSLTKFKEVWHLRVTGT